MGFWGSLAGARRNNLRRKVYQRGELFVNTFRNVMIGLSLRETVWRTYGARDSFLRFDPVPTDWANVWRTYGALETKMPP